MNDRKPGRGSKGHTAGRRQRDQGVEVLTQRLPSGLTRAESLMRSVAEAATSGGNVTALVVLMQTMRPGSKRLRGVLRRAAVAAAEGVSAGVERGGGASDGPPSAGSEIR
jgi:hypothetical protein